MPGGTKSRCACGHMRMSCCSRVLTTSSGCSSAHVAEHLLVLVADQIHLRLSSTQVLGRLQPYQHRLTVVAAQRSEDMVSARIHHVVLLARQDDGPPATSTKLSKHGI